MKFSPAEKRQLLIFGLVAFGVPYLMGLAMWYVYRAGGDTSAFANAQMMYPAAGAMLALLATNKGKRPLPRLFYIGFLALTGLMALCCLASVFAPALPWLTVVSLVLIGGSLVLWGLYLADGKRRRTAGGLRLTQTGGSSPVWMVLLFLALYLGRLLLLAAAAKLSDPAVTLEQLGFSTNWLYTAINFAALPLNFFLAFAAFFGEEYGWRGFLQPLLQKRFGLRGGVVLLGVLWGFWHLPLNVFYYSPSTWLQSLTNQIVLCVCLAVFFGYAQLKTRTVWVPVILHYLNNNLIAVFAGSADVIQNQTIAWLDVLLTGLSLAVLYLPFLASKVFCSGQPQALPLPVQDEPAQDPQPQ